ncbi:MAG: hypothetical protein K6B52_05890 [Clostridiales bacterium]|nr:hypothetical protein [Clostridiales bacterium]
MFYRVDKTISEININEIDPEYMTVGYITGAELSQYGERFGFAPSTVEACRTANPLFRTDVEVHEEYTFTELRIVTEGGEDDWIAIYLMKNFLLVVDILDRDQSTKNEFVHALRRFPISKIKFEKIVCAFIESLIVGGNKTTELAGNEITSLEEQVAKGTASQDFNMLLLEMKKRMQKLHNYYEQILDVAETLEENDNDIFDDNNLIYVSNLANKVTRLRNDVDSLSNSIDHLQDAYSSFLDLKLNHTMKIFTVLTSIFFPLTIIVGWYGMNFESMPEFKWRYGYIYVILLSLVTVLALTVFGHRKKWF